MPEIVETGAKRITGYKNARVVWEVEFHPDMVLKLEVKPKFWRRVGLWLCFGLKGRDISD